MNYDEAEDTLLETLVNQRHYERTGQPLLPATFPCVEAIDDAMNAMRDADRAVTDLLNDTANH